MITTQQTILHTSTIEVKVIKVDNKQMTLSVFRQLPEGCVFDVTDLANDQPNIANF